MVYFYLYAILYLYLFLFVLFVCCRYRVFKVTTRYSRPTSCGRRRTKNEKSRRAPGVNFGVVERVRRNVSHDGAKRMNERRRRGKKETIGRFRLKRSKNRWLVSPPSSVDNRRDRSFGTGEFAKSAGFF